jgi:Prokaryotic E2 family E
MIVGEGLRRDAAELAEKARVPVDVQQEGLQVRVIMRQLPLPPGAYNICSSDVLFLTDVQYPLSAMDMFWLDVAVTRSDGSIPLNADSVELYGGRHWRRFSWHRHGLWNTNGNPLLDHFEFMQARFALDVRS